MDKNEIKKLVKRLSLAEKAALLSGTDKWGTAAIERLGIRSVVMTDGPHGIRANEEDRPQAPATSFPTGAAMAASWDPELIEQVGAVLGRETHALGCDVLLGPCVNIIRHPLAGRNFESYSEDPYLAGRIGTGWVRGVQGEGVGASLKHFACNNQETERWRGDSQVDERTLREIYLAQFEMVVKEARPWTVMCAYNRINGVYASQHDVLLNQILRKEWGFDGAVISDWGANHTTVESVLGGLDLEMPGPARWYGDLLVEAIGTWQVDEAVIDRAAGRILELAERTGRLSGEARPAGELNSGAHAQLARRLAEESMVLLKNDGGLLPLEGRALRSLAVLGPMAAMGSIGGGGSSYLEPPYQISPLEGLREMLGAEVEIQSGVGCSNSRWGKTDPQQLAEAVELARRCEAAVVCVGYPKGDESEGYDRPDLELPGGQNELVRAVLAANPRTVVVVFAGSPVTLPWIEDVPAALLAHYPGQEGGRAVAEVVLGVINPSGKLAVTWPKRLEDTPAYTNFPGDRVVRYGEGIFVGYRYYDYKGVEPLFPFGHGLSYTQFELHNLEAPSEAKAGEAVMARVKVTNRGQRKGKAVVQLYVSDLQASLARPPKELKGFTKLELEAGETGELEFRLEPRAFAFWDSVKHAWTIEAGEFKLLAGFSAAEISLETQLKLVD